MKRGFALCLFLLGCSSTSPLNHGDNSAPHALGKNPVIFAKPPINTGNIRLPDYRRVVLKNGAVLLLHEKKDVPFISASAVIKGGTVADGAGKNGTAALVATLLEKGAGTRNAVKFANDVAFVGGQISADAALESVSVAARFLSRDADLLIELLSDMLMQPHFDQLEFDKLRARHIEFLKAAKESDPRGLISTYGTAFLFGDHPYGRPQGGDETSLSRITLSDVKDYYRDHMGGDRLILALAGDFDADEMAQKVSAALEQWTPARAATVTVAPVAKSAGRRLLLVDKPGATQAYFWLGAVGVNRHYPQRAALNMVNTVFGGRFTSMLNTELRVKSGLTYGAGSRLTLPVQRGALYIRSYTQTEKIVEAVDLAMATLDRLHANGLDADALDSARNYILGQFPTGLETGGQLAAQMATLEFYNLERSWIDDYAGQIRAVGGDDARQIIESVYPQSEDLVLVVLGDARLIREGLQKYGKITELKLAQPSFDIPVNN